MASKPVMKDFNILTNFKSSNSDLSLSDNIIPNPIEYTSMDYFENIRNNSPSNKVKVILTIQFKFIVINLFLLYNKAK